LGIRIRLIGKVVGPLTIELLRVNQDGKRDNQDGKFLKGLSEVLAPI
jgi:hypothetical protein